MDMSQKSQMLHAVASQAQQDQIDEANPAGLPKTDEQLDQERKEQASEIDGQAMDLERMNFGAKDLKAFSSMTVNNGEKTFAQDPTPKKDNQKEQVKSKGFYEQILD
mmetsp:Transcript_15217/g.23504  ORF Transcript_15217/g.23504 Transcript_15217/m.23504 type:complete len:107 (+) Transcript_15217:547-867(+)